MRSPYLYAYTPRRGITQGSPIPYPSKRVGNGGIRNTKYIIQNKKILNKREINAW
jgi:hypothetical protein